MMQAETIRAEDFDRAYLAVADLDTVIGGSLPSSDGELDGEGIIVIPPVAGSSTFVAIGPNMFFKIEGAASVACLGEQCNAGMFVAAVGLPFMEDVR